MNCCMLLSLARSVSHFGRRVSKRVSEQWHSSQLVVVAVAAAAAAAISRVKH